MFLAAVSGFWTVVRVEASLQWLRVRIEGKEMVIDSQVNSLTKFGQKGRKTAPGFCQ